MWDIFAYIGIAYTSFMCVGIAAYIYARKRRKTKAANTETIPRGWGLFRVTDELGGITLHIIPMDDAIGHEGNMGCGCDPRLSHTEYGVCVIHNSFDGREAVEWARQILDENED